MNKKFLKGCAAGAGILLVIQLLTFAIVSVATGGIGVYTGAKYSAMGSSTSSTMSKMNQLKYYIDEYFMEDVTEEQIADGIYKGMLEGLNDPYSCYYTKDEYASLMEDSSGVYCGIGATVTQDTQTGVIYIVSPFEGGAAKEAGIVSGDIVEKVDGKDVTGKDLNEVVSMMKGKEGTKVKVEFYISKTKKHKTFELERRQIEVPTVEYKMDGKIGYIAISAFDAPTDEQFIEAVKKLEEKGMEGLIIDLRNNGGGMLESVVNMLDYMLPKGSTIVSTKDKNGKGDVYTAKTETTFDLPLAVLINGNTASASEVFSGAIKDYEMGELVGTTSFGKGIVQSVIPLKDGTAIKITTSKYYTPSGKNIHGTGINPDVKVELDTEGKSDNQYKEAMRLVKAQVKKAKEK